jgi:hypothetical protein
MKFLNWPNNKLVSGEPREAFWTLNVRNFLCRFPSTV